MRGQAKIAKWLLARAGRVAAAAEDLRPEPTDPLTIEYLSHRTAKRRLARKRMAQGVKHLGQAWREGREAALGRRARNWDRRRGRR